MDIFTNNIFIMIVLMVAFATPLVCLTWYIHVIFRTKKDKK